MKALRKAHFVFYVQSERQQPDEKIASRIADYLADWTKVYSIRNIQGAPGVYDEPEDRVCLLTDKELEQNIVIENAFAKILGQLYMGNISLQGLMALAASGEFPDHEQLNSRRQKFIKYFGSAESAYKFSNMDALVNVLLKSSDVYEDIVADSQLQKLKKLKADTLRALSGLEAKHNQHIGNLSDRLESLKSDIRQQSTSAKSRIKHKIDSVIGNGFKQLRSQCETYIDRESSSDKLKNKINSELAVFPNKLKTDLEGTVEESVCHLQDHFTRRFSELPEIKVRIPEIDIDIDASIEVDVDNIKGKLEVSLGDVLEVGTMAASGAGLGALGGPIGIAVGTGAGALIGLAKKALFGDGGKSKAKEALKEELSVCQSETKGEARYLKNNCCRSIERFSRSLMDTVEEEISNLDELQAKVTELKISLR